MEKKSNFTAFWFIPLFAFVLALGFTLLGVIGWRLLKPASVPHPTTQETALKNQPSHVEKKQPIPEQISPQNIPSDPIPVDQMATLEVPVSAGDQFKTAFAQCLARNEYPCLWQDTQDGIVKQFAINKKEGPVVRTVENPAGTLISQTAVSQQGTVILYRKNDTTWYFDTNGLVRQISVGPGDAYNNYFYDANGQLNSCLCADKTTTCCTQAPNLQHSPRTYCEMVSLDEEFCPSFILKK